MEEWNDTNFDTQMTDADTDAAVFFTAVWCPHCRAMRPLLDAPCAAHPDVRFAKVDIDKSPEIAARFRVRSIPQLLFFKKGKMTDRLVGFRGARELDAFIEKQKEPAVL